MISIDSAKEYLRGATYKDELGLDMDILEDIMRLIEYLVAQNDRKNVRMAEMREDMHSMLLRK